MRPKKMSKSIALNKTTVANLEQSDQKAVRGGIYETKFFGGCASWHPVCFSEPIQRCNTDESVCICEETYGCVLVIKTQ